jgi:hypothetical protein
LYPLLVASSVVALAVGAGPLLETLLLAAGLLLTVEVPLLVRALVAVEDGVAVVGFVLTLPVLLAEVGVDAGLAVEEPALAGVRDTDDPLELVLAGLVVAAEDGLAVELEAGLAAVEADGLVDEVED